MSTPVIDMWAPILPVPEIMSLQVDPSHSAGRGCAPRLDHSMEGGSIMKKTLVLLTALGAIAVAATGEATISNVSDGAAGTIPCTVQSGSNAGERHCSGIFTTFDGAPIDVNIGVPPPP